MRHLTNHSSTMDRRFSKFLGAGLLTGTLDIIAAFALYYFKTQKDPLVILKYIASGVLGKRAYSGGQGVLFAGLMLHFLIATIFSVLFFLLYPHLKKYIGNKVVVAIIYGLFIWIVMNMIVVPLSAIKPAAFDVVNALINAVILILCFGFPLVYLAEKKAVSAA